MNASVLLLARRPRYGFHFSVENHLDAIRKYLTRELQYAIVECKFESRGIWRKVLNGLVARQYSADLRHVTGDVNYLGLFLPTNGTIQTILDCRGLYQKRWLKRKLIEYLWIRLPLARCQTAIAISQQVKDEIESVVGITRYDIRVIPLAIHEEFRYGNREYRWDLPRIVMVGTAPNKNLPRTLSAIRESQVLCEVTLCGDTNPETREVINHSGLRVRHLTGLSAAEMASIYRQAEILLYVSLYEGFGMPIPEAQTCGTVVITSNVEPMLTVAGPAGAAFVNPESELQITAAIQRVVTDQTYRDRLIRVGRENAERYTAKQVADQYSALYLELMEKNGK